MRSLSWRYSYNITGLGTERDWDAERFAGKGLIIRNTYDFSGKTIILFITHGKSGFAGTLDTVDALETEAIMLDELTISRDDIQDGEQEIVSWL